MNTPDPLEFGPMQSLRVLLVDDHDDLRKVLGMMLKKRRGYAVETAASGLQAISKARDFCPHVVISDITMPGMDGFQMMNEMKAKDLGPFKSIALSGYDLGSGEHADSQYDAHLTKPVDFNELFETIERLMKEDNEKTS